MKTSRSTLIGILLIAGALALHFSKSKPTSTNQSPTPTKTARPILSTESNPSKSYNRKQLRSLSPASRFQSFSQAYLEAEELVLSHQKKSPPERQQALLQALALLHRIQTEDPAWKTELIAKRIEQTIIALLDLQRTIEKSDD